jgi:hypothetical protein
METTQDSQHEEKAGKPFGGSIVRPYNVVCMDASASPLERETSMLIEWNKSLAENSRLKSENVKLRSLMIRIYNSGYKAGHHDTVEAGYVDIHDCDMDTYHAETVDDILSNASDHRCSPESSATNAER